MADSKKFQTLVMDGCDDAILGYTDTPLGLLVVYGYDELLEHFTREFEEEPRAEEMAQEWISFNIEGAYVGPGQPLLLYRADRDMIDEMVEQEEE